MQTEKYNLCGNAIKRYRALRNMNREELAEASGIPSGTIGNYETGRMRPKLPNLLKLCKALGCHPEDIYPYAITTLDDMEKYGRPPPPQFSDRARTLASIFDSLPEDAKARLESFALREVAASCPTARAG